VVGVGVGVDVGTHVVGVVAGVGVVVMDGGKRAPT
jgi:hypothetical protein